MLIPERFRAAHDEGYARARDTGRFANGLIVHQLMALRKDGHEFPIELSLGSWEKSGKTYFSGFIADISERLKSRIMTDRLGRIVENATNEFYLFEAETMKIVFANSGALKNLGYKFEDFLELTPLDLVQGFAYEAFEKAVQPLRSGTSDVVYFTETMIRANSSTYDAEVVVQLMQNENPPLFLAVVSDVSDRVTLEQSLRRSQKLEAVGQLAGGIAHDFNNLLGIILGNLEMLSRKAELDDRNIRRVDTSLKATKRAADLTKQILGFSRLNPAHPENVNVNNVLSGMHTLIQQSAGRNVAVELKLQDDLWATNLDQGDLEDAIVNLCVNAGHAMENGGNLNVETRNVTLDQGEIGVNSTTEFVAVSISDNGDGISRENQEKIFEPFFTTKEKGQGTGLGLAMVFGFVHRSKGEVKVYSELGMGTTFTLYLPRSLIEMSLAEEDALAPESIDVNGLFGGSEKILIVDDESELAEVAAEYLSGVGYEVLVANNAEAALLLVQQHSDIALVFTDIVMPGGMNGFQLAVKLFQTTPGVKVILTSGFAWEGDKAMQSSVQFVKYCVQDIVQKPYQEKEFLQRVRHSLDWEDLIKWTDDLDTGVPTIDEDHRLLGALLNIARVSVMRGESDDRIRTILGDLTSCTIYHFDREEVVMGIVDYPDCDAQMLIHKMSLSRLMRLVSKYEASGNIVDARQIVDFLRDWLMSHIEESRQIYPTLTKGHNQQIRAAVEEIGHQSREET